MELSHDDCLEVLADPSTQTILEKLGYEYSNRGLSEFRKDRPNILPALVRAVIAELERCPIFPPEYYAGLIPECGVFIRKEDRDFIVMTIDKPSVWSKETFSTAEGAATSFIRMRCDAYWLGSDAGSDERPKCVQYSWLPGTFDDRIASEGSSTPG